MRMIKGSPPRISLLPITIHWLEAIQQSLANLANPDRWAVSSLAFFGFFQLGELMLESTAKPTTNLAWGDVAVDSHTDSKMILKMSKCDKFGTGSNVIEGRVDSPLRPVTAILNYIELWEIYIPGQFFLYSSHRELSKQKFIKYIRDILSSLGLHQDQYVGQSF